MDEMLVTNICVRMKGGLVEDVDDWHFLCYWLFAGFHLQTSG